MTAVENALSTSFCAVAAFIRVEPVTTSGPVSTPMNTSTSSPGGRVRVGRDQDGAAPPPRGRRASAPRTYGVRPLAASPTTTSPARTHARASSAPPAASSSASSTARHMASGPPARWAQNQSPGEAERRRQLGGVEHAEPAGGARAEVVHPAAATAGPRRRGRRPRRAGQHRGDGRRHRAVVLVDHVAARRGWAAGRGRRCAGCAARWARRPGPTGEPASGTHASPSAGVRLDPTRCRWTASAVTSSACRAFGCGCARPPRRRGSRRR